MAYDCGPPKNAGSVRYSKKKKYKKELQDKKEKELHGKKGKKDKKTTRSFRANRNRKGANNMRRYAQLYQDEDGWWEELAWRGPHSKYPRLPQKDEEELWNDIDTDNGRKPRFRRN